MAYKPALFSKGYNDLLEVPCGFGAINGNISQLWRNKRQIRAENAGFWRNKRENLQEAALSQDSVAGARSRGRGICSPAALSCSLVICGGAAHGQGEPEGGPLPSHAFNACLPLVPFDDGPANMQA